MSCSLEEQFDVGVVLEELEGAPVAEQVVERHLCLTTHDGVEATAGVGDVEVLAQGDVMHEHEADTMSVHPLLPANMSPGSFLGDSLGRSDSLMILYFINIL